MRRSVIVRVTGAAVLYLVFGNKRKENGMPVKSGIPVCDYLFGLV